LRQVILKAQMMEARGERKLDSKTEKGWGSYHVHEAIHKEFSPMGKRVRQDDWGEKFTKMLHCRDGW